MPARTQDKCDNVQPSFIFYDAFFDASNRYAIFIAFAVSTELW